jgi:hypothetical protein
LILFWDSALLKRDVSILSFAAQLFGSEWTLAESRRRGREETGLWFGGGEAALCKVKGCGDLCIPSMNEKLG